MKPTLNQISYLVDSLKQTSLRDELDLGNAFGILKDNMTDQQRKLLWALIYNKKKNELKDNLIMLGVKKL